jgi:predicted adenylyl cyclase CyaB
MKSHEIEVKLEYKNKETILKKLKSLGAIFKEKYSLDDTYLGFSKSMSNKNKLVRVRKRDNFCELTFKGKAKDNSHIWKRIEINTEIKEPAKIIDILSNLGLTKIKENASKREIYMLGNLEIAFIDYDLPAKLSLIELEGEENEINDLLNKLGNLAKKVGEDYFKSFDKK